MKKIILAFFISLTFLYSNTPQSIFSLINEFKSLNTQIKVLKNTKDNNSSSYKEELESLSQHKEQILIQLPSIIAKQEISKKESEAFLKQKQDLENEVKEVKANDTYAFINANINLYSFKLNEVFFKSLLELEELFKQASNSQDIQTLINASLKELEALMDFDFNLQKSKLSIEQKALVDTKEKQIQTDFQSYIEVLNYLKDNASLLSSNYVFSALNLQVFIDKINQNFNIPLINSGKILISFLVLVIFYVLALFLQRFSDFAIKRFILQEKKKQAENIFVIKGKKPVKALLFVYALSVCLSIAFYPAPVNILIANIFYIIYALLIAWFIMAMFDGYGVVLAAKFAQKSGRREVANLIIKILDFAIIIITGLFILAHLGFSISAIIAPLGIGGLAVALAAKDIIANFFASIVLAFDDSFNQGDWVEIAGIEGTIVETGLRKTTLRTFENSLIYLPNSAILNANIKNWSKRRIGRMIRMYLGVGYDSSPEQLKQCIDDLKNYLDNSPLVAHADDNALNDEDYNLQYKQKLVSINDLEGYKNACYVSLSQFADSSINIELYFYTKAIDGKNYREARQQLMLDFMRIIEKNKLSFAFPSMSVYLEKTEAKNA